MAVWLFGLSSISAHGAVSVYVQQSNSLAWVRYECTAGEVIRAFALDVTVSHGQILGVSNFLRGPSTVGQTGYGVFPASFRDHIVVGPGTNVDWNVPAYTPLAVVADNPGGTQPGLGSSGVTLEFGALWDPAIAGAGPGPTGTLCSLQISEAATVMVSANAARGGVVVTNPAVVITPVFTGALVHPQPPEITSSVVANGIICLLFGGGELESAPKVTGPWTGTGNSSGNYSEPVIGGTNKFYRVRSP